MQTPSVGRIVHYVRIHDSFHVAAIVADVPDSERGVCSLRLFYPNTERVTYEGFVLYDARMSPGTWHYPGHVGTVQWHESEDDEASKREGPVSNSPEADGR